MVVLIGCLLELMLVNSHPLSMPCWQNKIHSSTPSSLLRCLFIYSFTCCWSSKSWLNPLQILIRRALSFISGTALQAEFERERSTAGVEVEAKSSLSLICITDSTDRHQMRPQRASLKPPPGSFITASQYQQPPASPHYPRTLKHLPINFPPRTESLHVKNILLHYYSIKKKNT